MGTAGRAEGGSPGPCIRRSPSQRQRAEGGAVPSSPGVKDGLPRRPVCNRTENHGAVLFNQNARSAYRRTRAWRACPPAPRAPAGLTLRPLGGGPTVQPHHHGGEGHLALHAVLADGVDDARREVDVQVAEEDDAVRVLGTEAAGSEPPGPAPGPRPLSGTALPVAGRNGPGSTARRTSAGPGPGHGCGPPSGRRPLPAAFVDSEDTFSASVW